MVSPTQVTTRTVVGLEIHVQLATRSKLFCPCPVRTEAPPNSCVCPVCLGHPGSLPVMNREAVALAIRAGLAFNCRIASFSKWDRKSYYYPDLPKNYQISQYDLPLCGEGRFDFPVEGKMRAVRIRRAHLEEDAGKNIHDQGAGTLVDLNRTGTPLLEIVTEPDINSAEEAYAFCTELQRMLVYLGVTEGVMQKGQMRFEPNVNVQILAGTTGKDTSGDPAATPIAEVKNLNSFRAVKQAIAYEQRRQLETWQRQPDYLLGRQPNENRGWLDVQGVTEYQRVKEAAHDYRYFPEPDLVPVTLSSEQLDAVRAAMPELPLARRRRFVDSFGMSPDDASTIVVDAQTADCFEAVVEQEIDAGLATKQFVNLWMSLAKQAGVAVAELGIGAEHMAELVRITCDGTISKTAAQQIAGVMAEKALHRQGASVGGNEEIISPARLAETLGLVQIQDTAAMQAWVDETFAANAQAVADAVGSPKKAQKAAGFLRGQVMRLSKGQADPKTVGELIEAKLAALADGQGA